jgi:hypothetical protein
MNRREPTPARAVEDAPTFRRPKVTLPVPTPSPAWDAIALHTTPGIAAYKPLEVELLYNGVGLDVVTQYPRVNFKEDIAKAFNEVTSTSRFKTHRSKTLKSV